MACHHRRKLFRRAPCASFFEAGGTLFQHVNHLTNAVVLALQYSNRIGPAGAEGVAVALANSPSVRELHLSGNALEDIGVAALVKGAVAGQRLRGDNDNAEHSITTQPSENSNIGHSGPCADTGPAEGNFAHCQQCCPSRLACERHV